jgi:NAD(P)H dehydrogenase (quinone)
MMSKVLVLYYSSYGHIEAMANAVAEGARQAGAHVDVKRVPELVPEEIARKSHYKFDQVAPIAKVDDLAAYDAIVIGAGTRFGRLSSQMAGRRQRCSRSSPTFCTSAWWLSASITAMPGR